jgi:hypothetical protein
MAEKNHLARASSTTHKALTQNKKTQLWAQAATKVLTPAVKPWLYRFAACWLQPYCQHAAAGDR